MLIDEHQARNLLKCLGISFPQDKAVHSACEVGDRSRFGGIRIANACQTTLEDLLLKALFANAVGGGQRHCNMIAEGLIAAHGQPRIQSPIAVRFAATKRMPCI